VSLPWFKFNVKAFVTDTQRLTTEAKGAYLLLMLDYYEQEEPPPDDDMVLATIAGLPMETWLRYRPYIAAKFEIEGGVWRHAYVEAEIADCHKRHDKAVSAATSGRSSKLTPKHSKTVSSRSTPKTADAPSITSEHSPEPSSKQGPEPENSPKLTPEPSLEQSSEVSYLDTDKDSKKEGAYAPSPASEVFPAPIPENFTMAGRDVIACQSEGYSPDVISATFNSFFRYHHSNGTMDSDWPAAWWRWWNKNKPALHPSERPRPKAPPRVVLTNPADPPKPKTLRKAVRPVPDDWMTNIRHAEIANEFGLDLVSEAEAFRDHCLNKPTDWSNYDAAFRNWLKSPFRQRTPHGKAPGPKRTIADATDRLGAEINRELAEAESAERGGGPIVQILPKV
jgi:uncharacterized protein YdaU (DUF1376 family)